MNSLGGTQSVIRCIYTHSIGSDHVRVVATWSGPSHLRNAALMGRAFEVLSRLPRRSLVHFHISNGGAWLREGSLIHWAKLHRHRVVVSLHGYDFPAFARAHSRVVRGILGRADHVLCLSEAARAEVARLVPAGLATVVANPVEIDLASPPAEDMPPVALFAGTVGYRKGVDVLVEAWQLLVDRGVLGVCRVVGPIDDFMPPPTERMTLEAPVAPAQVPELLRSCRLVVLPSRAEGMPMILTEALAAARPFVATAVGGTALITPDSDMIVPVDDCRALADAIERYLSDRHLAGDAGRRGQRHIIETRSPEVVDQQFRMIYDAARTHRER